MLLCFAYGKNGRLHAKIDTNARDNMILIRKTIVHGTDAAIMSQVDKRADTFTFVAITANRIVGQDHPIEMLTLSFPVYLQFVIYKSRAGDNN